MVGFELWLLQQYVEVQQFEIPVLIDNPVERMRIIIDNYSKTNVQRTHSGHVINEKNI